MATMLCIAMKQQFEALKNYLKLIVSLSCVAVIVGFNPGKS